uniref:SH2 domain-containing protein n=1 Tax=Trichuris muris TaxID=70415 RepID=A0A5S6Q8M6_TRIMR
MGNSLKKVKIGSTKQRQHKDQPGSQNDKAPSSKLCNSDASRCVRDSRTSSLNVVSETSSSTTLVTGEYGAVTYDVPWDRGKSKADLQLLSRFGVRPEVGKDGQSIVNVADTVGRHQEANIYDEPWEKARTVGQARIYGNESVGSDEATGGGRAKTEAISFQPVNLHNHGGPRVGKKETDSGNLEISLSIAGDDSPSVINAALKKKHGLVAKRVMRTYADSFSSPSAPPKNENAFHLVVVDDSPKQDKSCESPTTDMDWPNDSVGSYEDLFSFSKDSPVMETTLSSSPAGSVTVASAPDNSISSIPNEESLHEVPEHRSGATRDFEKEIWYHGRISRQEAEERMVVQTNGAFLVRRTGSENTEEYALTIRAGGDIMHMKIQKDPLNRWVIGAYSLPFLSISDLVDFYSMQKLPIQGVRHVRLTFPVMP